MTSSQKRSHRNLKRKSQSLGSEDSSRVDNSRTQENGVEVTTDVNSEERPFWVEYTNVYEKIADCTPEAQTTEECVITTRIVDITSARLAQEIQKLDITSVDHWATISELLVRKWDQFFSCNSSEGLTFSDIIPINRYKANLFGAKNILLKKKGPQEKTQSTQKEKKTRKKDDSQTKVSKPLQGVANDKPSTLVEHMMRVMNALEENCEGSGKIDYFKLVVDPESFSSTVYNIFTVSFLIRDGMVSVSVGRDESLLVNPVPASKIKKKKEGDQEKKHFIINLTTKEWEGLVRSLHIRRAMINSPDGGFEDDNFSQRLQMSQSHILKKLSS